MQIISFKAFVKQMLCAIRIILTLIYSLKRIVVK